MSSAAASPVLCGRASHSEAKSEFYKRGWASNAGSPVMRATRPSKRRSEDRSGAVQRALCDAVGVGYLELPQFKIVLNELIKPVVIKVL